METLLQRYNTHKRFTLDRITANYTARGVMEMREFYASLVEEFFESLESGKSSIKVNKSSIPSIENLLESHFKKVVKVGVSDGYREVSPHKELGSWLNYNIYQPIEDTFSVSLAKTRDTLADRIAKDIGAQKKAAFLDIIGFTKDQSLENLKKTYEFLSKDWREGKSSIKEVKEALQRTLVKEDASINRTFRTETTRWFNESRREYFVNETSVSHVQIFAVTDGRTSEICETRNGFVIPIGLAHFKRYMPPFHPNCRTVQRGLIKGLSSHDRLIQRGLAMKESTFVKLPKGWAA